MPISVVTGGAGFLGSHLCERLLGLAGLGIDFQMATDTICNSLLDLCSGHPDRLILPPPGALEARDV